jgi:ATP-dependent Clp protease ATP-binding subunit ClpA
VVTRVVDKFILQLELQLADRNVHIQLDDGAREWLTSKGYDKLYGARPMGRLIQEKIKQPLAEELLFGKLVHGGEVKVKLKEGEDAKVGNPLTLKSRRRRRRRARARRRPSRRKRRSKRPDNTSSRRRPGSRHRVSTPA